MIMTSMLVLPFFGIGQSIEKFSIDSGGASASAGDIEILYTIGEVNVQERSTGTIQLSEGFINSVSLQLSINPKVFLQGPFLSPATPGLMNDDLRTAAVIPTTSPYPDGISCNASVFIPTGADAIVDWVLVELRDASDRTNVIESHSALLQRDGDVVDVDGISPVSFTSAAASYYILINHRNHLGILSADPVAISGVTSVDLSSNPSDVFGGTNAVADMGSGNYAMFGGDVNGNGQVQNSDLTAIVLLLGSSGYSEGDLNLNGQVQNSDINNTGNPNLGKGEQF